ncbi:MAG: fused MFS/spermidine synthase [Opitutus sp.]
MQPFAFTIFAGAFLLFAVQPLIGKFILPWFGGGTGVWATCLLFFQTVLLGGYIYAHLLATRLAPRKQALVHVALLLVALLMLPITPAVHWKPQGTEDPIWRILLLLTATVGIPYFVLSATGPLMQHWFGQTHPGRSPYRLYALSNTGSLLALLGYPFFFERMYSRQTQSTLWSLGLGIFALGCSWCAWRVWKSAPETEAAAPRPDPATKPTPMERFFWFSLAGVASILLLATTNKLTQDLAVIPFLWVLPLALYLITFILCFDHPRWYSRGIFSALFALGALVDLYLLFAGHNARLPQQVIGYSVTFFAACMVCHGELVRLRPPPSYLTSFYLHLAGGGAAGAFLVAVIAPMVLDRYLELQFGLWLLSYLIGVLAFIHRSLVLAVGTAIGAIVATVVIPTLQATAKRGEGSFTEVGQRLLSFYREHWAFIVVLLAAFLVGIIGRRGWIRQWQFRTGNFLMLFSLVLGILFIAQVRRDAGEAILTSRGFYGVLKVFEHNATQPDLHYYTLVNGVTSHGLQFAAEPQSAWPTTYYAETSGVGLAIGQLPPLPRRHIGLVGLGTGTVASYGRIGDKVRIYEIDKHVEHLARTQFTYLEHCPSKVDVIMGDARLSMERELAEKHPQAFDVLALDAFSSDAIPVHLLTKEAFATYLAHMKPDGVIAVHTSNRYLDLEPVVQKAAEHFGLKVVMIVDNPPTKKWWIFRTTWMLLTRDQAFIDRPEIHAAAEHAEPSTRSVALWTDDHTSVYEILK